MPESITSLMHNAIPSHKKCSQNNCAMFLYVILFVQSCKQSVIHYFNNFKRGNGYAQ